MHIFQVPIVRIGLRLKKCHEFVRPLFADDDEVVLRLIKSQEFTD